MIEQLAARFRTYRDCQAVRAYLLSSVVNKSAEDIRREINASGDVGKMVARGGFLVRSAVESQLITPREMRDWVRRMRRRLEDSV
jgi:hypothetical protein